MKKTGQLLKEAREKQGVSLNAVSAATKISVKVLEAIEDGDQSQLPPKTFVRGFVQTYAAYLKLDPKTILDVFQEEVGTTTYKPAHDQPSKATPYAATTEEKPKATARETAAMSEKTNTGFTKWLLAGLALLLFVAIYFVSQTVQKYKRESEISQLPPEITSEEALPESPSPSPGAAATPEASPGATPDLTIAGGPSPSPSASPVASPVATAVPGRADDPLATSSPIPSPTPTPAATASPSPAPASTVQNVTIKALDTVKVDFSIDGGPMQSVTLDPEQKRKFSAKKSFDAQVSDGGAISIIHNGRDKGVPGNLGQPLQLTFPPKE